MPIVVIDAFEVIEIDQRQPVARAWLHHDQFTAGHAQEVPTVEQPCQFVGRHLILELPHHAPQGVLVRLQGIAPLAHALARGLDIARIQAQPCQHDEQGTDLDGCKPRVRHQANVGFDQIEAGETEEHHHRTAQENLALEVKQAKHQDHHIQHQKGATGGIEITQQAGLPRQCQ
ncbi:hypothetical protein D3C86_1545580 [compost metagenome]